MGKKIIRSATIGPFLDSFCTGTLSLLREQGHDVIALSSPDEGLKKVGLQEKVRTIGVPMERRMAPLKDLKSLWKMILVLHKERPDMIHSMTPKAGLISMIAAWLTRVPVRVHTFTGLVWPTASGLSRKILMTTDRILCACATHVIPEGEGVLENLRDYGITKKPMKVLGYGNVRGVDMDFYSRRPEVLALAEQLRKEGVFTFVFVGRIVGDKGINELISAVLRLRDHAAHNFRLVLIGRYEENLDPVSPETRKNIESLPYVEAIGEKFGDDLLAWYAASDCFVFPSYREGFPNTVLEAGALDLPSIVTDINGSREIITLNDVEKSSMGESRMEWHDGHLKAGEKLSIRKNGVVIPSKDEQALYDAMEWMMTHPQERQQMADNARPMVAARYEQSFVRKCLMDFYDEILENSK